MFIVRVKEFSSSTLCHTVVSDQIHFNIGRFTRMNSLLTDLKQNQIEFKTWNGTLQSLYLVFLSHSEVGLLAGVQISSLSRWKTQNVFEFKVTK